jgi:3-hydroxyisobutyrate dehydrogenase-like beta-hydroxyacid dehydrogenase
MAEVRREFGVVGLGRMGGGPPVDALLELAVDGGYVHAGPPGAGHFVKLVHNGIEFGMLQAIAEERRRGQVGGTYRDGT